VNGDRIGEQNENLRRQSRTAERRRHDRGRPGGGYDRRRRAASTSTTCRGRTKQRDDKFRLRGQPLAFFQHSVSVNFATTDVSAKSGEDYESRSCTLTSSPGDTSKAILIDVLGDRKFEGQGVFYVNLSGATGALVVDSQGSGIITNDDR
jgi:hypothetical protein